MIEHLYPHMLQEYYVAKIRKAMAARDRKLAKVRTRADVIRLKTQARRRLAKSFGKLPARTPLNARVTGSFERKAYRVEKVILESRPGLPVTANLYIPKGKKGPFPCVLGTCGHSGNGKAESKYQAFCQALATKGYLVLIYDPLSQGERLQYPVEEGAAHPKGCCQEHNMMGNQMGLLGEFFGKWRVWDGIRSLDYLLSRPEADPTRAGVTGNSGGGTLTTYLNAFDDRFTMAAPSCFVTTYLCNMENELPADAEQIPPNIIQYGLDMADFPDPPAGAAARAEQRLLRPARIDQDVRGPEAPLQDHGRGREHPALHRPNRPRLQRTQPRGDGCLLQQTRRREGGEEGVQNRDRTRRTGPGHAGWTSP
ncbi:MAG: prolyl oligopeptidase family serine peptidase [Planctomycetes bacterium]|nr:prolyl oligopeptidase family serine peptidase [Planctomycetota bacterium]